MYNSPIPFKGNSVKYTVNVEHRDFFRKNGWIQFESLLTQNQVANWNLAIEHALSKRLHLPVEQIRKGPVEKLLNVGYDLWRDDDTLKKGVSIPSLAQVAFELTQIKPIRLGFDRLLMHDHFASYSQKNFNEMSCINGLSILLLICLTQGDAESDPIFPNNAGSGIYFSPSFPFDFSQLASHPNQRYFLIGYADYYSQYLFNENDPFGHQLKNIGYVFGDPLKDDLHPIVLR